MALELDAPAKRVAKVVVATSVMLTFISFWRAAAIVLNDLGSSALYAGGIAELAVRRSAPRFNLTVVLFAPKTFNGLTNGLPLLSRSKGVE